MPYEGMQREDVANHVGSRLRALSVEEQCISVAAGRVGGWEVVRDGLRAREKNFGQQLTEWMIAHDWTGGETPDLEALLDEFA